MCENLRLDRLTEIPPTVTELRITDATWNKWKVANLKSLQDLHTLRLFNMTMNKDEIVRFLFKFSQILNYIDFLNELSICKLLKLE